VRLTICRNTRAYTALHVFSGQDHFGLVCAGTSSPTVQLLSDSHSGLHTCDTHIVRFIFFFHCAVSSGSYSRNKYERGQPERSQPCLRRAQSLWCCPHLGQVRTGDVLGLSGQQIVNFFADKAMKAEDTTHLLQGEVSGLTAHNATAKTFTKDLQKTSKDQEATLSALQNNEPGARAPAPLGLGDRWALENARRFSTRPDENPDQVPDMGWISETFWYWRMDHR
jgi:hypothetical protein